jgi:hypothetical protein
MARRLQVLLVTSVAVFMTGLALGRVRARLVASPALGGAQ